MKSSAMRDLMAITERPDVISLAGGQPDTSTFPPESYAALMSRIAAESTARALQYGPTDGMAAVKDCIVEVMGSEDMRVDPDDVLVTTGGQQVIDLMCKTFMDPGDVIVAEAPTYPGSGALVRRLRGRRGPGRDGRRRDAHRRARGAARPARGRGAPPEVRLHRALVPEPGRRDHVPGAPPAPGGDRPRARAARAGGQPVLAAALRGRRRADACSRSMAATSSSTWARSRRSSPPGVRLGWAVGAGAGDREDEHRQAGRRPVLLLDDPALRRRRTSARAAGWSTCASLRELYRRRRDAMLDALAEHFPREAEWTYPQGGMFLWATLPDYIDTTDLLARALQENVAFVPGRAAYLDGRGGSSMRLNFSGVGEDDIREGIRRIGKVVREQVGAVRHAHRRAPARPPTSRRPTPDEALADVLHLPRAREPARRVSRVAVLKGGRSLERQVSLRSGARVEDALERLGHDVIAIDVGADLVERLRELAPDVAFVALHGRDGEDGTVQELLELVGVPYTGLGCLGVHPLLTTRCWPSTPCATPASRRPTSTRSTRPRSRSSAPPTALPAIEERLEFPIVVKPAGQGSALGIKFAPHRRRRARRAGVGLLLRRQGAARAPRRRARPGRVVLDGEALPVVEAVPRRRGLLRLRGPLRDRPHRVRVPGRPARGDSPRAPRTLALGVLAVRLPRLRARGPDARARDGPSCTCSRPTRSRA